MTTENQITDKERGLRFRVFRKEVLQEDQTSLAARFNKTQSVTSMIEKGQIPSAEILLYCVDNGLNVNWYLTGEGPMLYSNFQYAVNEEEITYSVQGFVKSAMSEDPFDKYIDALQRLINVFYKVNAEGNALSELERRDLMETISDSVEKLTHAVKNKLAE